MTRIKIAKFLLPGLFLLILGIGNIVVGSLKHQQYLEIIAELKPSSDEILKNSPLHRIKSARSESQTNNQEQQDKALARAQFYSMVTLGGKAFVSISICLLCAGSIAVFLNQKSQN